MKSKIDMDQLRKEIKDMRTHDEIFKVLRDELTKRDRWKYLERGNPKKGGRIATDRHFQKIYGLSADDGKEG